MDKLYQIDYAVKRLPLDDYMRGIEREIVLHALESTRWNRTQAAKYLGVSFRSMRYRLASLGIEDNGAGQRKAPKGFSKVWPKLREAALAIHGHKCNQCQSTVAPLHVDHIKPIKHYPELALDLSNLQVLCAPCNLRKGDRTS